MLLLSPIAYTFMGFGTKALLELYSVKLQNPVGPSGVLVEKV
jgi:hypothetical protein